MRLLPALVAALVLPLSGACTPPGHDADAPGATDLYRPDTPLPQGVDATKAPPRDAYGRPYGYAFLGAELPDFAGQRVDGTPFTRLDLADRWTVIEIWGLWCHDSMNDAPYAAALSRALAQDPDIDFMTIHTPYKRSRADKAFGKYDSVAAYFDDVGYSFPTIIDNDASLRETLQITWTPTYLVVAPDLTVQGFRTGLADAGGEPVKDFVRAIAEIRGLYRAEPAQADP